MGRVLRVGIGEEIGDQRNEAGAARGLRQRPSRDRRDQEQPDVQPASFWARA